MERNERREGKGGEKRGGEREPEKKREKGNRVQDVEDSSLANGNKNLCNSQLSQNVPMFSANLLDSLKEFVFEGSHPCREICPKFHENLLNVFKLYLSSFGYSRFKA